MFSPIITGLIHILTMSCVSGDEIQIAIHRREDVVKWLKKIDHEGSNWDAVVHHFKPDATAPFGYGDIERTVDITDEIIAEYITSCCGSPVIE